MDLYGFQELRAVILVCCTEHLKPSLSLGIRVQPKLQIKSCHATFPLSYILSLPVVHKRAVVDEMIEETFRVSLAFSRG